MKTIITALANQEVNEQLKQQKQIQVLTKDIQYQEGILEMLEIEKTIDTILISELLPRKYVINTISRKNKRKISQK